MVSLLLATFVFNTAYAQDNNDEVVAVSPVYTSLKKALRNADKVEKLRLSNNELKEFPEGIFKLKKLRLLILDSNEIKVIPSQISELKELRCLSISSNQLSELPSSIGELSKLRFLYAERNLLTSLPKPLFNLTELEDLFASHNKLTELPKEIKNLQNLERLVISYNQLRNLPDEIGHAYSLKIISITNNNLTVLPPHFYELRQLKELYLSNNKLTSLSADISNFLELSILSLDGNQLSKLPPEMGNLLNMESLFVDANKLDSLPATLSELFKLKYFYIGENPLKYVPADYSRLTKLQVLDLRDLILKPTPQVFYDIQNNGTKIQNEKSKDLYQAKLLLSQAKNKRLTENYEGATKAFDDLMKLDTNNSPAMAEYAAMLVDIGQFEKAEKICRIALSKNNTKAVLDELRTTYSNSINKTNKIGQVIEQYQTKIKEKPNDPQPSFELGKFYYDQMKYNEAKSYFVDALKKEPNHIDSHFYLSLIFLTQDKDKLFVLPALRMIMLDPKGKRARTTFPFVLNELKVSTGVKKKNGNLSYTDSYIIRNEEDQIVYKSESPQSDLLIAMLMDITKNNLSKNDKSGEDSVLNEVVKMALNTNKNNKELFKIELTKFVEDTSAISKTKDEVILNYYLPFFKGVIDSKHFETFTNLILSYRNDEPVYGEWLNANPILVDEFNDWLKNYKWKTP